MTTHNTIINQLIEAVIANDVDDVNELLHKGADPNAYLDSAAITPLHYAAQNDCILVIPLLIEAGADVFAQTEPDGYTPIEIATLHGHEKVAQVLLAYGNNADRRKH